MSHDKTIRLGFERKGIDLPIASILPIRQVKDSDGHHGKYRAIRASIQAIGLVEPLVVYPNKEDKQTYLLMDGHMRLKALQELGRKTALCLVAVEDDPYTYNDKVNRLSIIQEHRMISKALESGISPEDVAKALGMDPKKLIRRKELINGLHPEVLQLLKEKQVSDKALKMLKRVRKLRQVEMAQLMVSMNNFTFAYARALFIGTPKEQMLNPEKPKVVNGVSAKELVRMEKELETMESEFKAFQNRYGEDALHLNTVQRYVKRLLENHEVKRFLEQRYPELHEELEELAVLESL